LLIKLIAVHDMKGSRITVTQVMGPILMAYFAKNA